MFYNHLKGAFRVLRKNRLYTAINLIGMAMGIAAVLLIFRMISYEMSFNKNFAHYDSIVRVVSIEKSPEEGDQHTTCTPLPAMEVMRNEVSQFEYMAKVHELWATLTIPDPSGGAPLKKLGMDPTETAFFTEPDFLKIFNFEWLSGDPETALSEPSTILLTRSWAEKCFDHWEEALGQTILVDNLVPVTVKGVVEDLPPNCDFDIPFLVSYPTVEANADLFFFGGGWGTCSSNNQVYAKLYDPTQMAAANEILATVGAEEYSNRTGKQTRFHLLQPLSDLHYSEEYHNSGSHTIAKSRLRILAAIGLLILIMACFNFINLATAQASLRAREVGVRKTLGSGKSQLIWQFMTETGLIVCLAVILGVVLASMLLPLLTVFSHVPSELPFLSSPLVIGFLLLITVLVTLVSGIYPALAMARFRPVQALNNNADRSLFGGAAIRKSLVVLQFSIAHALIIGAGITILQLDYIRSKDLGFDQDLVYTFNMSADSSSIARQSALKQKLLQLPSVQAVSLSSDQPLSDNTWSSNFRYASRPEDEPYEISLKFCDVDYQKTYGIELLAGKWLAPSDTMREAVVNEMLLKKLGIIDPEEVVGQQLRLGSRTPLEIVGVTKDFHTHSFREQHEPIMLTTRNQYYWEIGVKVQSNDLSKTANDIQKVYNEVLPEQVFDGQYLDERIARYYEDDSRLASICKAFGFLAIVISCLGLFGLATHAAAQRIKEIGIRKVLGASVAELVSLLSREFLTIVFIALLIGTPLAWYFMDQWLDYFAYHIDLHWSIFALSGLLSLTIAFLTVSYKSIRAAMANPVKALRSE